MFASNTLGQCQNHIKKKPKKINMNVILKKSDSPLHPIKIYNNYK